MRTIIPLTRVCRYWRKSIISIPENWTTISNSLKNLAALSLERAKAAVLEIHLDMWIMRGDPQFLNFLTSHFQNTETLWVTGLTAVQDLSLLSRYPMINLQSLSLSDYQVTTWDRSIDPFELSAYALRYLQLTRVPLYPSFLKIKTLTGLELCDYECNLHLDTLLDFLEENRSLTSAGLDIWFAEPSLRSSRRRAPIGNRLQSLRITCHDAMDGRALISSIALSKGAELEFTCQGTYDATVEVADVLSGISTTHLSNLLSPTFMRYRVHPRIIKLHGPNGTASFFGHSLWDIPFAEFPLLSLANIRRFHLDNCGREMIQSPDDLAAFNHLPSFSALETFTIEHEANLPHLPTLLSNPSASPSLRTLAFVHCVLTEEFMGELAQFASDRKSTASAWLHRVVIVHRDGTFPSITSIRKLEEHVPVVNVQIATKLPTDL